jgi:Leucine-rich repeat (LRR) protein
LPKLRSLALNDNQFEGELPDSLAGNTTLIAIGVHNNKLTGTLPRSLGSMTQLVHLRIDNNRLTGTIPQEIISLPNLVYLNLTDNKLSGEIPAQIGEATKLGSLLLGGNQLSGQIPIGIGSLTNLSTLRIEGNNLTGPLPAEISNLIKLSELRLNDNELSGVVPAGLLNLTALTTLHLQNNKFSGSLPAGLDKLPLLTSFDASGNRFGSERIALIDLYNKTNGDGWINRTGWLGAEGTECSWYGVVCVDGTIRSLQLSANALQGVLPGTLSELRELTSLMLPNNQISGPLPTLGSAVSVNINYNPADTVNAAQMGNTLSFHYSATNSNPNLTGLGLRIHYNSSQVSLAELLNILPTGFIAADLQPRVDSNNFDNDPSTDRYITVAWADISGQWPGAVPKKLFDLKLTLVPSLAQNTQVRIGFSVVSSAVGYGVRLPLVRMNAINGLLDIDGNGKSEALSDGLLVMRGLFGFSGEALVRGAVAQGAQYASALQVLERLSTLSPLMDIDGDGRLDALTDGLMLIRYLFGFRGEVLIRNAVGANATRTTATQLEQYLQNVTGI